MLDVLLAQSETASAVNLRGVEMRGVWARRRPRVRARHFLVAGILVAALAVVPTAAAHPQTVSATVALTQTDFTTTVELAQYDPADHDGQPLSEVECTVDGNVQGTVGVENLEEDEGGTITSRLSAQLTLSLPDMTTLVSVSPTSGDIVDVVDPFDGTVDFGGTSGVTHTGVVGSGSATQAFTDAATLALFTGTGTVNLPFAAVATSSATGSGNVASQFTTNAGADVSCTYTHAPTAVTLKSFTATRTPRGVLLKWRTAAEVQTLGFNVYREQHGKRVRINRVQVPAASLRGRTSAAYSLLDRVPASTKAARYWLQAIEMGGSRTWYGPAAA
jgi:hypothetical protein